MFGSAADDFEKKLFAYENFGEISPARVSAQGNIQPSENVNIPSWCNHLVVIPPRVRAPHGARRGK